MFPDAIKASELVYVISVFFLAGQFQNTLVETLQLFCGLMVLNQIFFKSFLENGIVEALCF